ncbi:MAG: energy transducer TonB, partial [Bacteroides thetaiotaomicron]|nr:energy transducer TonB [Bacteroides thetaiotaomicron]MDY4638279.1 energy transducer TonB [Bacteroides thetaiotaomicron]
IVFLAYIHGAKVHVFRLRHPNHPIILRNSLIIIVRYMMAQKSDEVRKQSEWIEIVDDTEEVTDNVSVVPDNVNEPYKVVWIPPVVETEEVVEDVIHVSVEVMPEFPGGSAELLKYLSTHIKYPTMSQEMGSQGRVIVQFVVDKDGSITNPTVVRGVDAYLDKEAIRVISGMPKWKPGVQNGKKVRVKYTVPVVFRLQ